MPRYIYDLSIYVQRFTTDVLIIGGGAALNGGANAVHYARVTVLCKGDITSGSSHWAQGGVAAVTTLRTALNRMLKIP